jgi:hypothetical protein
MSAAVWVVSLVSFRAIRAWWRDVQADPDRRTNLFFLYASCLLTAATIGGFLWLAGILDWRGSNGQTEVELIFTCESDVAHDACMAGLERGDEIKALLDLRQNSNARDGLDFFFGPKLTTMSTVGHN